MFQSFKCILCAFLYILSDWLQSSVLYLKLQHFIVIKFKLCVQSFKFILWYSVCPSCLTGYKMKPPVSVGIEGLSVKGGRVRKYEKMYQKGVGQHFSSSPPLPLVNN